MLLAVALALVIALPAEAKKPDKPDNPDTGFKPMACTVDVPILFADVKNVDDETLKVPADDSGLFTLDATEEGNFNETRYAVEPGDLLRTDVLCVEVTLVPPLVPDNTLSDLRVRWLGCEDCGLYRATGKDLRSFNSGVVFSAGVSVADWTDPGLEKTVAVMPNTKSDSATMTVKIGIDTPEN
ncbi:MAG: hypothetical protein MUQ27_08305 [Acidimicrobiia bacterium]|nr:hypothetical protein [Acidimicrobiia bacterium]